MKKLADQHLKSRDAVLEQKNRNFQDMLETMTCEQHQWWFRNAKVKSLDDLAKVEISDGHRILDAQSRGGDAYCPFLQGEILLTNSGSTESEKYFSYSLENWWRYVAVVSRGLSAHGVGPGDVVLSTDIGRMQSGYRAIEDAAAWICGATVLRNRNTTLTKIIDLCHSAGVTVLISNDKKLHRMATLLQDRNRPPKIRSIIQTGMPLTQPKALCDAFCVPYIIDYYGDTAIGNIYWTCSHGHRHVNEDSIHTVQQKGMTCFSNLLSLPVWNYNIGAETLLYSYKGRCGCGSYLATVDQFAPKSYEFLRKD